MVRLKTTMNKHSLRSLFLAATLAIATLITTAPVSSDAGWLDDILKKKKQSKDCGT